MADEHAPLPRSAHGGYRPGAGRKRGSPDRTPRESRPVREEFGSLYRRRMREESAAIVEAAVVASRSGDHRILLDTLARHMGRPVQSLEVSGPGGSPIRLQAMTAVVLAQMSDAELDALESLNRRLVAPVLAPSAPVVEVDDDGTPPT